MERARINIMSTPYHPWSRCNEAFVVSGSEDSQIYVWHRHNATLLEVSRIPMRQAGSYGPRFHVTAAREMFHGIRRYLRAIRAPLTLLRGIRATLT